MSGQRLEDAQPSGKIFPQNSSLLSKTCLCGYCTFLIPHKIIRAVAVLCLTTNYSRASFRGSERVLSLPPPHQKGAPWLSIHTAGSSMSTRLQSRQQAKRGANARFQQTSQHVCPGSSAHGDAFDLDPGKPQSSTKVEWASASEKP